MIGGLRRTQSLGPMSPSRRAERKAEAATPRAKRQAEEGVLMAQITRTRVVLNTDKVEATEYIVEVRLDEKSWTVHPQYQQVLRLHEALTKEVGGC